MLDSVCVSVNAVGNSLLGFYVSTKNDLGSLVHKDSWKLLGKSLILYTVFDPVVFCIIYAV